jgi:hypothetical protein
MTAVHGLRHDKQHDLKRHHEDARQKQELPEVAPVELCGRAEQLG